MTELNQVLNILYIAMASATVLCIIQKSEFIPVLIRRFPAVKLCDIKKEWKKSRPILACWLFCPWCIGAWVVAGMTSFFYYTEYAPPIIRGICGLYVCVKLACWSVGK